MTETVSSSTKNNVVKSTASPSNSWNATTFAPNPTSGCSANCTFTLPAQNSGSWKRCEGVDAIYFAGHVNLVVDRLKNTTMTTTVYAGKVTYTINGTATTAEASDVMNNGSFVYSRTDVNEAGTVTAVVQDYLSSTSREMYVHTLRPKQQT